MRRLQRRYENHKNQDLWITSYADLVSAVLAVLVLIVSFSKIDIEKYDTIQHLMIEKKEQNFEDFMTLNELKNSIDSIARENNIGDKVNSMLDKNGLTISFDSAAQFDTSRYTLKQKSVEQMHPIFKKIVEQSRYRVIHISGHTDDVKGTHMTNWELSALRALAIQKKLEELGLNNQNVTLLANAENKPLISYQNKRGNELHGARAKNRRVSIIIKEAILKELE